MDTKWHIERLNRSHSKSGFNCGEVALNDYLACYALQNQELSVSQTFVAISLIGLTKKVLGYYSLAASAIDKAHLPPSASNKRFPKYPLPIIRLARLAVDCEAQGQGLGEFLLMDALYRAVAISDEVGCIAVIVDAKHEKAKEYYLRYEFESLPTQPLTLWLPLNEIKKIFKK